jgi:AsmA protein
MKKLIKLIFGLLVLVFILIVAAAVILPMVIDPNDYKPQIIEAVKQQTGRDLVIEGDIGLSVFPKVGLNLGKTSLSNAAGFEGKAFASMDAVNIQVALMPLLDKKVEMDEIILQGLALNLQRNKQGVTNWDDLAKKPADKQAKPEAKKAESADQAQLESLAIGGIRIENANILWQDDQNGQRYEIKSFNLITGPLAEGDPVDIELNTAFASGDPAVEGQLEMNAVIQADVEQAMYTLTNLKLALDAKGKTLPNGQVQLSVAATPLVVNLKQQTLQISALDISTLGLGIKGDLNGKAIMGDKPQFNGALSIADFNARELIKALGQPEPQMADDKALTRVGASFELAATTSSASLNNLKAKLDDTSLTGKLAVTDFASQAVTFDLTLDEINLDRYLPPADTNKAAQPAAAQPAAAGGQEPELFPVETLRKLNANGIARIGKLTKDNLKVSDIVVKVNANGGKVNVKPTASLYQGKLDSDVTIDASQKTPTLKLGTNLAGVQIEPLLKDMQGEAKLAGTTNAKVNVSAVGNTESALKKTLNGTANFSFTDGALVGVNIAQIIREGLAKLKGQSIQKSNEPEQTDFSSLGGSAKITNGVIDNRDFNMRSPLLRATGAGTVDLVNEQLDYLLSAKIVGSLQGQGGKELEQLKGVTIPVKITGPFSKPSYKPDLSAVVSDQVKEKAKAQVEEKKKEVEEKLQDKLKGKLKGLF